MNPDELVRLCEALIGDLDLAGARRGNGVAKGLSDEDFILLMRFMSGDRPRPHLAAVTEIAPRPVAVELDDDDDDPPSGGDFNGITLF